MMMRASDPPIKWRRSAGLKRITWELGATAPFDELVLTGISSQGDGRDTACRTALSPHVSGIRYPGKSPLHESVTLVWRRNASPFCSKILAGFAPWPRPFLTKQSQLGSRFCRQLYRCGLGFGL